MGVGVAMGMGMGGTEEKDCSSHHIQLHTQGTQVALASHDVVVANAPPHCLHSRCSSWPERKGKAGPRRPLPSPSPSPSPSSASYIWSQFAWCRGQPLPFLTITTTSHSHCTYQTSITSGSTIWYRTYLAVWCGGGKATKGPPLLLSVLFHTLLFLNTPTTPTQVKGLDSNSSSLTLTCQVSHRIATPSSNPFKSISKPDQREAAMPERSATDPLCGMVPSPPEHPCLRLLMMPFGDRRGPPSPDLDTGDCRTRPTDH